MGEEEGEEEAADGEETEVVEEVAGEETEEMGEMEEGTGAEKWEEGEERPDREAVGDGEVDSGGHVGECGGEGEVEWGGVVMGGITGGQRVERRIPMTGIREMWWGEGDPGMLKKRRNHAHGDPEHERTGTITEEARVGGGRRLNPV